MQNRRSRSAAQMLSLTISLRNMNIFVGYGRYQRLKESIRLGREVAEMHSDSGMRTSSLTNGPEAIRAYERRPNLIHRSSCRVQMLERLHTTVNHTTLPYGGIAKFRGEIQIQLERVTQTIKQLIARF